MACDNVSSFAPNNSNNGSCQIRTTIVKRIPTTINNTKLLVIISSALSFLCSPNLIAHKGAPPIPTN